MKVILTKDLFVNDVYRVRYGDKQAEFTIVDEDFIGSLPMGLEINRINCVVRTYDGSGNIQSSKLGSLLIGFGDMVVGAESADTALAGKLMNKDNMSACVVTLYE